MTEIQQATTEVTMDASATGITEGPDAAIENESLELRHLSIVRPENSDTPDTERGQETEPESDPIPESNPTQESHSELDPDNNEEVPLPRPWKPSWRLRKKLADAEKKVANQPHGTKNSIATAFLAKSDRYPLLEAADEIELAKEIEKGNQDAKDILINCNLKLLFWVVNKYVGNNRHLLEEYLAYGKFGLIRAAEKFDHRKGFKFSTYATLWIKQSIQREKANTSRAVRFPSDVDQRERSMGKLKEEYLQTEQREPTDEEYASELNYTPEQVRAVLDAPRLTSLDKPVGEKGESEMHTMIAAETGPVSAQRRSFEEEVDNALCKPDIAAALKDLDDDQRTVVEMSMGLGRYAGEQPIGMISKAVGLSIPKVKQEREKAYAILASNQRLQQYSQAQS